MRKLITIALLAGGFALISQTAFAQIIFGGHRKDSTVPVVTVDHRESYPRGFRYGDRDRDDDRGRGRDSDRDRDWDRHRGHPHHPVHRWPGYTVIRPYPGHPPVIIYTPPYWSRPPVIVHPPVYPYPRCPHSGVYFRGDRFGFSITW